MKTLPQLAADALQVQDACNPIALATALGGVVNDLRAALKEAQLPNDHDSIASHQIYRLWVGKLASLCGMPTLSTHFQDSYCWAWETSGAHWVGSRIVYGPPEAVTAN